MKHLVRIKKESSRNYPMNKEFFKDWMKEKIEKIDDLIQDWIDRHVEGDDADLMEAIADCISDIIESTNVVGSLKEVLIKEFVKEYTSFIFSNWYTGDMVETDYYYGIFDIVSNN